MAMRRVLVSVEFSTSEGVRIEFGEDGWHVLNIRQLGEGQRHQALALLERAEAFVPRPSDIQPDPDPMLTLCEQVSRRFDLRMTHRRTKQVEVRHVRRVRRDPA